MVIDAGGGTVDLSTYSIIACSPLRVEEVSAPGCMSCWDLHTRYPQHIGYVYRHPSGFHAYQCTCTQLPGRYSHISTRLLVYGHSSQMSNICAEKLKNSRYRDDITTMLERFDKATKTTFKDSNEKAYIHFGSLRDRDIEVGIRSGQLILEG